MAKPEASGSLQIEVVYSPAPRQVRSWVIALPAGSTLESALLATAFSDFPELRTGRLATGVWGAKAGLTDLLQPGDRVEVYRVLRVDPKVARRERFKRQGAKTAGLFSKTREGAKAGY
jgi:putative ubiquitin-RnfH superfamily antitoxin RatB of RatAB toxin-antitoxin module